jgi:hypothetical protein
MLWRGCPHAVRPLIGTRCRSSPPLEPPLVARRHHRPLSQARLPAAGPGATSPAIIFPLPPGGPFLASQNNRRLRPSAVLRPQAVPRVRPPAGHRAIEADWRPRESTEIVTMATIGTFIEKDGRLTGKMSAVPNV